MPIASTLALLMPAILCTAAILTTLAEYDPINLGAPADSRHTMQPIIACHWLTKGKRRDRSAAAFLSARTACRKRARKELARNPNQPDSSLKFNRTDSRHSAAAGCLGTGLGST
jgi:hypothetical protein